MKWGTGNGSDTLEKVRSFLYNEAEMGLDLKIGSNLGRLVMRKGGRGCSMGNGSGGCGADSGSMP